MQVPPVSDHDDEDFPQENKIEEIKNPNLSYINGHETKVKVRFSVPDFIRKRRDDVADECSKPPDSVINVDNDKHVVDDYIDQRECDSAFQDKGESIASIPSTGEVVVIESEEEETDENKMDIEIRGDETNSSTTLTDEFACMNNEGDALLTVPVPLPSPLERQVSDISGADSPNPDPSLDAIEVKVDMKEDGILESTSFGPESAYNLPLSILVNGKYGGKSLVESPESSPRSNVRKSHQKQKKNKSNKNVMKKRPSITNADGSISTTSNGHNVCSKPKESKAGAYLKNKEQSGEGSDLESEDFSEHCLSLLAQLVPDTSDPDPLMKCAFVDSRHTFLEMCQFRHYQFDSLRRAKHSSLMLLYHLHFPDNKESRPTCTCCNGSIREVRWHCDQCADFDVCESCYTAAEDTNNDDNISVSSNNSNKSKDNNSKKETVIKNKDKSALKKENLNKEIAEKLLPKYIKHPHPLTPFRITYV
jgi:hypothetical protein